MQQPVVIHEDEQGQLRASPGDDPILISSSTDHTLKRSNRKQPSLTSPQPQNTVEGRLSRVEYAISLLTDAVHRIEQRQIDQTTLSANGGRKASSVLARKLSTTPLLITPTEEEEMEKEQLAAEIAAAEEAQAAALLAVERRSRSTGGRLAEKLAKAMSSKALVKREGSRRNVASSVAVRAGASAAAPSAPPVGLAVPRSLPASSQQGSSSTSMGPSMGTNTSLLGSSERVSWAERVGARAGGAGLLTSLADVELNTSIFGDLYEGGHGNQQRHKPWTTPAWPLLQPSAATLFCTTLFCTTLCCNPLTPMFESLCEKPGITTAGTRRRCRSGCCCRGRVSCSCGT